MQILVDIHLQDWISDQEFRAILAGIPDRDIRFYPDFEDGSKIRMLACDRLRPGLVRKLPNLELIQKLGAGVDTMLSDPDLHDHIRITRLKHATTAMEMARFCLAHVLKDVQNIDFHREQQQKRVWETRAPKRVTDLEIGVLGLGHIGAAAARLFADAGFRVSGWSRTRKSLEGITCLWGKQQLKVLLAGADYVVSMLPSTPETVGLFDIDLFRTMKRESVLINVGRGTLVVEEDLVEALDSGFLRYAVLDVFHNEPLPADSPLWHHPGIIITPHVSGWDLDDGLSAVAENFRRLEAAKPLLHEIDRQSGY
jgi:glyoxylate/hydroxypyruvate reductase A